MKKLDWLPNPISSSEDETVEDDVKKEVVAKKSSNFIPAYGERGRRVEGTGDLAWTPTNDSDFNDGGAYPEIPVLQYPYGIGKTKIKANKSNAVTVSVDEHGKIRYDALLRNAKDVAENKVIHYNADNTRAKNDDFMDLDMPDEEQIEKSMAETGRVLENKVDVRLAGTLPVRSVQDKLKAKEVSVQYLKYTPVDLGCVDANKKDNTKIIKMVEQKRDPMSPPRFRLNGKVPNRPKSPPAPILHSPPRKITDEEKQQWDIPPCISNWKNPKGYVIPLDKRLACDGRGLTDHSINDKFAKFSEALYIADRKAREAVEMKNMIEKKMAQKEKDLKEMNLLNLAEADNFVNINMFTDSSVVKNAAVNKRNMVLDERQIGEKIRNMDNPAELFSGANVETAFDQRLYNKEKGMDSGYGNDDETFNVYDKPLNSSVNVKAIYVPNSNLDTDIYNIGGGSKKATSTSNTGTGPVQFEKIDDPYNLTQLFKDIRSKDSKDKQEKGENEDKNDKRKRKQQ